MSGQGNQKAVVELEDLWFSYGDRTLLHDVTLSIEKGELVTIVGPNGGGKTTFLKLLLGLLQPDRGTVRIFGLDPIEARGRVGYTPQHAILDLRFPVSVLDVVLMGRLGRTSWFGRYSSSDRLKAMEALEQVGVRDLATAHFSELSGGQRQRILIARSLATGAELLLLDEPTASLDIGAEAEFNELLGTLASKKTILVVSHNVDFVSETVDRVVCIHHAVAVHPTAELTNDKIRDLLRKDLRLVRHDHDCLEHDCESKGCAQSSEAQ